MTSFHPWNSMGKGATFIALHFHPKTRFRKAKFVLVVNSFATYLQTSILPSWYSAYM